MTIFNCEVCDGIDLGSFNNLSILPEEGYCTCEKAFMNAEYAKAHNVHLEKMYEQHENLKKEDEE